MPRMADIVVHAHYRDLLDALDGGPGAYDDRLRAILRAHFEAEPWEWMPRLSSRHGFTAPDRPAPGPLLRRLCDLGAARVAESALRRLTAALPPPTRRVECHILPSLTSAMGGCCYAPGKIMIGLGGRDALRLRLLRNVAHEYSHSVRLALFPQDERHGWGPAPPMTVRAYLVMEGLAECLADAFHPWDRPDDRLPPELEPLYWEAVGPHLGESGDVYTKYVIGDLPGLPAGAGYAAGARLVHSFLDRRGVTAVGAQALPWEDVWSRSGYPFAG